MAQSDVYKNGFDNRDAQQRAEESTGKPQIISIIREFVVFLQDWQISCIRVCHGSRKELERMIEINITPSSIYRYRENHHARPPDLILIVRIVGTDQSNKSAF